MAQISRSPLLPPRTMSARLASPAPSALRRHAQQQRRPFVTIKNSADGVNLQQAAELLAQAAVKQTQGTSLALSKEAVAELKLLNDRGKLLEDKVAALAAKLESKLDALVKADKDAQWISTVQTLQWAITNAERFSFTHDNNNSSNNDSNSIRFVREALGMFIQGRGLLIPHGYFMLDKTLSGYNRNITDGERAAYNQALSTQIHQLTGVKPRIAKEKNGEKEQYAIYRV